MTDTASPFVAAEVDVEAQDDGVMGKIIVRLWHWICPILRKLIIIYIPHARTTVRRERVEHNSGKDNRPPS